MASLKYKEQLPDYGDLENETGKCPGYRLYVLENDGLVSVQLQPTNKDEGRCEDIYSTALTVEQAEKLIDGLEDAIRQAKTKH